MNFKKGQIINRSTGIRASDRKAQYHLKWGCNVSISNGVICANGEGPVLVLPSKIFRKMKNGTHKNVNVTISGLRIINASVVVEML